MCSNLLLNIERAAMEIFGLDTVDSHMQMCPTSEPTDTCVSVCVCVKNVRAEIAVCRLTTDACPNLIHCLSHLISLTHRGLWHIPKADLSIVQTLQWSIAFTYIKMSLGYRTAPKDLLSPHAQIHTHRSTESIPYVQTGSRPYLRQHWSFLYSVSKSFFYFISSQEPRLNKEDFHWFTVSVSLKLVLKGSYIQKISLVNNIWERVGVQVKVKVLT